MQVRINEITRRYFMPSCSQDHKRRLDDLTEQLFREYLDVAIAQAGCRQSDILCIRYLHCPICFESDKTDIELFQDWLAQLVQSLQRLFAKPDNSLWLRFPSQIEALKSVARSLAVNNMALSWAWQQMGIISRSDPTVTALKNQWLDYLWRNPQWAEATVSALVQEGTIEHLIRTKVLSVEDLLKLSTLAAKLLHDTHDFSDLAARLSLMHHLRAKPLIEPAVQFLSDNEINRLLALWSVLYPHESLANSFTLPSVELVKRVKVLSLLLLLKGNWFRQLRQADQPTLLNQLHTILTAAILPETVASLSEGQRDPEASSPATTGQESYQNASFINSRCLVEGVEEILPLVSQYGGLLFLLNVLNQARWRTGLEQLFAVIPTSAEEILEVLAIKMLSELKDDPVLAIFCGTLFAGQNKPNKGQTAGINQQALDQNSLQQISNFAQQLIETVVLLFEANPLASPSTLFLQLCQRKVRIESRPGWVNVFFKLGSIDTRVRAVGLDLDPDFVPWLGYVVKFYYE